MPYHGHVQETVREVVRVRVEGGQHLLLNPGIRPFGNDRPILLKNLIVAPNGCDWKACGRTGRLMLFFGDKAMYEAPVEVLMAEWQRYQVGAEQFFRPLTLPVRQSISLRLEDTSLPIVVDLPVEYKRDVI